MSWIQGFQEFYTANSFGFEVGIDLLILALAARAAKTTPALRWVFWSFAVTLFSVVNFQVLGSIFQVTLKDAMGTWKEVLINVPYIAFFAFGAVALIQTSQARRASAALSLAACLLILGALIQGLGATGNPLQNQIIHVLCFVCTGVLFGFGLTQIASPKTPAIWRWVSLGYIGLALAGLLFQITEIYPQTSPLGPWSDRAWTAGQLAVLLGLVFNRPSTEPNLATPRK